MYPSSGGMSDSPGAFGEGGMKTASGRAARSKSVSKQNWTREMGDIEDIDDDEEDDGDLDLQEPLSGAAGEKLSAPPSGELRDSSASEAGSSPPHASDVDNNNNGSGGLFDHFEPLRSEHSEDGSKAGAVTPQMESAEPVVLPKAQKMPDSSSSGLGVDKVSPHQLKSPVAEFSSPPSASPALLANNTQMMGYGIPSAHDEASQDKQMHHQEAGTVGGQFMFESLPSGASVGADLSSPGGLVGGGPGGGSLPAGGYTTEPQLLHPVAQHQQQMHPSMAQQQPYAQVPGAPMMPRRNPQPAVGAGLGLPPAQPNLVPPRKPHQQQRSQSTSAASSASPNRVFLIPTSAFPSSVSSKDGSGIPGDPISHAPQHQYISTVGGVSQATASPVHLPTGPTRAPHPQHQNPFSFLQLFASVSVQNLPLEGAIQAVRHGETYLGAIRDRLTQFAERRSLMLQQQQQRLMQQQPPPQRRASTHMYGGGNLIPHDGGPAPPLAKRHKPNELILDLPPESQYLTPRSDSMVIHIVYSSVFPRGSRELKMGNLNRNMPGPLDAIRVLEHDDAASALQSLSDGDVVILLEGVHRLPYSIENKRLEVIGITTHGPVTIMSDDMRPQHPLLSSLAKPSVHIGTNSAVRFFNVSIVGSTKEVSEAILVSERTQLFQFLKF
jgi:hypothetical protein